MGRKTLAFAALCALLCTLVGCDPGSVPDELIHVWRTDAPAYRDRHLEIQKEWIVFGTGGLASDSYPIVGVEAEPSGAAETRYTIHYRVDDGDRLVLRVSLTRGAPGTPDSLRIDHTDEIWRAESAPTPPKKGDSA
jgi:hypothetical protein